MIVVVGDVGVDVVARHAAALAPGRDTAAEVRLVGGGAAANVAAALGGRARLVGRVGEDALAPIALAGLDDRWVQRDAARPTGTCVVLVGPDGERTMLPDPGANAALGEVPLEGARVLYVSGYTLLREATRAVARDALARARAAGIRIAVDPASAAPLAAAPAFLDWIAPVDLLLPNEAEAAVLGPRMYEAAREVVVKRGAAGATWSDGTHRAGTPAVPASVRDTTGAGDAFAAGFLSAWEEGPEAALRAGAALAAGAVARTGARQV